jgi:DNA-binding response OmpR family regulator
MSRSAAACLAETPDSHATTAQTPTVLCIDDDPQVAEVLQDHLERYDVELLRAYHGMQGYWLAVTHMPDVIITDLRMPQGDGGTILECLRRNSKTAAIPVIVLTGRTGAEVERHVSHIGADCFRTKPVSCDQLLEDLRQFIALRPKPDEDWA